MVLLVTTATGLFNSALRRRGRLPNKEKTKSFISSYPALVSPLFFFFCIHSFECSVLVKCTYVYQKYLSLQTHNDNPTVMELKLKDLWTN